MSDKELVDKIVMFRNELERQNAGMGIMSLFDTICSYYGEQHRTIESQEILIHQLRGALGYPVPGNILEHPDIINGIGKALEQKVSRQAAEIESQKEEIRRRVVQAEINISLGETVINMQSEIESLKAITELKNAEIERLNELTDMQHEQALRDQSKNRRLNTITELAVKGLKYYADERNHKWTEKSDLAKATLSEIERLSHE